MQLLDFPFDSRFSPVSLSGEYRSLTFADSGDFHELREYELGDSSRRIDWLRSAGRDNFLVRSFHDEIDVPLVLLLDVSASFRFGDDRGAKFDSLYEAIALFIRSAWLHGMSGSLHGLHTSHLPIPTEESWLATLRELLFRLVYEQEASSALPNQAELVPYFSELASTQNSLVVAITDRPRVLHSHLQVLRQKNLCAIISIVHPGERELQRDSHFVFTDGKSKEIVSSWKIRQPLPIRVEPYVDTSFPTVEISVGTPVFHSIQSLIYLALTQ